MDAKEKVHVTYIIVILVAIIVLVLTGWLTGISEVADKIQFGLALSSILLAVFTIIFALLSNAALPNTLNELRGVTKEVTDATAELRGHLETIPTRLESMESKLDAAMVAQTAQREGAGETTEAISDTASAMSRFLHRSSINGCIALYMTSLALQYKKPFNLLHITQHLGLPKQYLHAYLVAAYATQFLNWSRQDFRYEVTHVDPFITEHVRDVLLGKITTELSDMAQETWLEKLNNMERYFMLPEKKSSDGNDSDDSTE